MVYWIPAKDSENHLNDESDISCYLNDEINEAVNECFYDWLDKNYEAHDIWDLWSRGRCMNDLWDECYEELYDEEFANLDSQPDSVSTLFGVDFICMVDDDEDELMPEEEEED